MKISSFPEMMHEYEVRPIGNDNLEEREKLLLSYKYTFIFEADFLEFDRLQLWIKENIPLSQDCNKTKSCMAQE